MADTAERRYVKHEESMESHFDRGASRLALISPRTTALWP